MARQTSKGICTFCRGEFSKSAMTRHLETCEPRASIKVISDREVEAKGKAIQVLARNTPPVILCEECGKPATNVCSQCIFDGKGWLCDDCAEEHECGEEMLLPVVNSPRVGMCAYTG